MIIQVETRNDGEKWISNVWESTTLFQLNRGNLFLWCLVIFFCWGMGWGRDLRSDLLSYFRPSTVLPLSVSCCSLLIEEVLTKWLIYFPVLIYFLKKNKNKKNWKPFTTRDFLPHRSTHIDLCLLGNMMGSDKSAG